MIIMYEDEDEDEDEKPLLFSLMKDDQTFDVLESVSC